MLNILLHLKILHYRFHTARMLSQAVHHFVLALSDNQTRKTR